MTPDGKSGRRGRGLRALRTAMRSSTMRRVQFTFLLFRISETATWVALLIWAFDRGGATATGVIAVAQLAPATVVAPFASVFADRVPRPKALRSGYALQGVTNLATALALLLDADFWLVAALAGLAVLHDDVDAPGAPRPGAGDLQLTG